MRQKWKPLENRWQLSWDGREEMVTQILIASIRQSPEQTRDDLMDQLGRKLEKGMAFMELGMTVSTNQLCKSLNQKRDF